MTETVKKYYDELNIFRAIIIIWVVIGHSFDLKADILGFLHFYAYTFHMDAFFLLSGILFAASVKKIQTAGDALRLAGKRFGRIMVPYFFFTAVSYVLKLFLEEYANNRLSPHILLDTLLGENNPNGGLWFLYTLFWLNILAILLCRLPSWLNVILAATLFVLYNSTPWLNHVIIRYVAEYAIFFFLGLLLANYYDKISASIAAAFARKKALMTALTLLMLTVSFTVVYLHFTGRLRFPYFRFLLALYNTVTVYLLSWLVMQGRTTKRFTMMIGNYGMDIYMIGYYVQITLRVVLMSMLGLPYLVYSVAMCICGLLLPIPISKLIVKKFRITRCLVLGDFSKKEVKSNVKEA